MGERNGFAFRPTHSVGLSSGRFRQNPLTLRAAVASHTVPAGGRLGGRPYPVVKDTTSIMGDGNVSIVGLFVLKRRNPLIFAGDRLEV